MTARIIAWLSRLLPSEPAHQLAGAHVGNFPAPAATSVVSAASTQTTGGTQQHALASAARVIPPKRHVPLIRFLGKRSKLRVSASRKHSFLPRG